MRPNDGSAKLRVLVAEDSPTGRDLLVHILESDPDISVIGTVTDGEEAIVAAKQRQPSVIMMDVHMPKLNGFEAARTIMETCPTPIVIVSGVASLDEQTATFKALEAGALAFVAKPNGIGHPLYSEQARQLVDTVKLMSEVKVVRRWPRHGRATHDSHAPSAAPLPNENVNSAGAVVAIGASTGGPIALKTLLSELPVDFRVPILIVQHIATGFTQGFAQWLAQSSHFQVQVAAHGQRPLPGHVYVAPDGSHMRLSPNGTIALSLDPPENGHRPSVSQLFRSVAQTVGRNCIGVLLTGMGRDGAEELKLMRNKGAVTIVQDRESSVVYGMPGEAANLGAAAHQLPPAEIASLLAQLTAPQ